MNKDLSRIVSYALRHHPEKYSLLLDSNGWVEVNDLVNSIMKKHLIYTDLNIQDFTEYFGSSNNKRHEIISGKIRARYGHSINDKLNKVNSSPPEKLFHGTTSEAVKAILVEGLKPMERQFVHLSLTPDMARTVAMRKTTKPILLQIRSKIAYNDGVRFFNETNIWLSDGVPSKYLFVIKTEYFM